VVQVKKFLGRNWGNLNWSEWVAFDGGKFTRLDGGAGYYRIRVADYPVLACIGQTGRDLGQGLRDLRRNVLAPSMPFSDPQPAAPSLWAWRDAEGHAYECSVAPSQVLRRRRLAMECWLLWQYRLETGCSTLCNFGHFPPGYVKSKSKSTKIRGGRSDDEAGAAADRVHGSSPMRLSGRPSASDWMGLAWSGRHSLAAVPGGAYPALYRIFDAKTEKLLHVGETESFGQRMKRHSERNWSGRAPVVSWHRLADGMPRVHLREWGNDLIGAYFDATGDAPELQFSGGD
jgi:hypothetical protein